MVWTVELLNGEAQAYRSRIPFVLAWALSIHKAHGQILDHVKVDLGTTFVEGQAYVALSRAKCRDGLYILLFEPSKIKGLEKVRKFHENLCNVTQVPNVEAGAELASSRTIEKGRLNCDCLTTLSAKKR